MVKLQRKGNQLITIKVDSGLSLRGEKVVRDKQELQGELLGEQVLSMPYFLNWVLATRVCFRNSFHTVHLWFLLFLNLFTCIHFAT